MVIQVFRVVFRLLFTHHTERNKLVMVPQMDSSELLTLNLDDLHFRGMFLAFVLFRKHLPFKPQTMDLNVGCLCQGIWVGGIADGFMDSCRWVG